MEKLILIQNELKAPKNQFNSFGKYKYRSLEDVFEALKPLLKKYACLLIINDEIKSIDGNLFVEATATLKCDDQEISCKSSAGIDINKKGMDYSQSYGSSSSYARKYALNGLFLIDDTKDSDATNTGEKTKPELTPNNEKWSKAVQSLNQGKTTIVTIKNHFSLSKENEEKLLNEAI